MESRERSRDRSDSLVVKHQHSFSESGRSSVPMWDSSDPDRAPPPLPLNPGVPGNSPITKPFASSNIEKAAALIASRALENAPSAYTSNPPPSTSPDRNLIKPHHRRMQSIQSGSVSRLSDSLERRSPDKSLSRTKFSDLGDLRSSRSFERSPTRTGSETSSPTKSETSSAIEHSVTNENTPPTSNMIAIQSVRNRQEADNPLTDVTNNTPSLRSTMSLDSLSNQILHITSIATNLQREMANLSRRSKDNATDLYSLREATSSRDEDIRKSLKDLVSSLDTKFTSIDSRILGSADASRSTPNLGLYLDDPHLTPTRKTLNFPRVTSPSLLEREITASPSVVSVDGAASIALLEKVLREMATKDGQEKIMTTLENVKAYADHKSSQMIPQNARPVINPEMMKKLEEILEFMKNMREDSGSKALVKSGPTNLHRSPSQMDIYLDKAGPLTKARQNRDRQSSEADTASTLAGNDDVLNTLKSVKQSLSHNGGMTNEVKALIRELRGEVLGMGRELARKLEATNATPDTETAEEIRGATADDVTTIVEQALSELKEHIYQIVQDKQAQFKGIERSSVETRELVQAVQRIASDMSAARSGEARDLTAERKEMISAVKLAWEDCKPEIALEHFGLERDEILDTIKEGLQLAQINTSREMNNSGLTNDDVMEAVRKGLQDFEMPQLQPEASMSRSEILETIREGLDNYDFPSSTVPSQLTGTDLSRDEIIDAVKEVLAVQTLQTPDMSFTRSEMQEAIQQELSNHAHVTKEVEFNREDLFDAIKSCLEGEQNPLGGMGERVVEAMHEFLGSMKTEFQQYSAANGRDTEQVLDALKDGLEELRAEVESYVDRAADVTGKDEIIDIVKAGFAAMQADMDKGFSTRMQPPTNAGDLLDAMDKEFEHLRETINKSLSRTNMSSDKEEILDAIRDISDDRSTVLSSNSEDVVRLVKEELEHMRTTLAGTLVKNGGSLERDDILDVIREGLETGRGINRADGGESTLSNTNELLDAFQDGVDAIRSEIQKIPAHHSEHGLNLDLVDTIREGVESIRNDINRLSDKQSESSEHGTARGQEMMLHEGSNVTSQIEDLKVMITQLRIKVEALSDMPMPDPIFPDEVHMHKDDLADLHAAIREVQDSVSSMPRQVASQTAMSSGTATKDDTDAIETLLRNVKARLDDMVMPDMDLIAKSSHVSSLDDMLREIKSSMEGSTNRSTEANKEDFTLIELLLKDVQSSIEVMHSKIGASEDDETRLSRTDLQVLESICLETKERMESFTLPDVGSLANKDDFNDMKDSIQAFCERFEADNDLTAQAFEARKIEHGGLATKIDDVKNIIGDIREEVMTKLNGSEEGIVELAKVLGMHHDNMNIYATAESITELAELVNKGFQSQMDQQQHGKTDTEERDATLFDKHEETTAELKHQIEEKFNELMTKYDETQSVNEAKLDSIGERDKSHIETIISVKSVAEDLKSLMDTLGSTVSETCEKMSTDARTVFEKVDDANAKLSDLHVTNAHEHGLTRDEVVKILNATSRLEGSLHNHQPAILAAVQEVLGIVGQHFEHSQQHSEAFRTTAEEIKSGVSAIPLAIPPLLPGPEISRSTSVHSDDNPPKEYDDSELQVKLDKLLANAIGAEEALDTIKHNQESSQASSNRLDELSKLSQLDNLDKLDTIQQQVRTTAEEISVMVATQTRLMAEDHESKAIEAKEAAIALEKRIAQKESVEAEIIALTQEKNRLADSMANLRAEHEELISQTKHLGREVGKLETALNIRQEEMRDMNSRAEALERRVLEGVMNHARSFKLAKPPTKKKITPAERDASMNLKRVPSTSSNATTKASSVKNGNVLGTAVGMALKKRNPLGAAVNSISSPRVSVDRRILSTSHVTGNRSSEIPRALVLAPTPSSGLASLKRSHSVKSNPSSYLSGIKSSWSGTESFVFDKENHNSNIDDREDDISDSGTERRTSFTGTYADSLDYGTNSSVSRNSLRSASYASSIGGTLNGHQDSIVEEEEHDDDHATEDFTLADENHGALVLAKPPLDFVEPSHETELAMVEAEDELAELPDHDQFHRPEPKYSVPSDSGIGSEPMTPDVLGPGSHGWQSNIST